MIREEAIEYIKKYRELDEKLYNTASKGTVSSIATKKCLEFWDMAIQALSQEPCDDVISRQVAIDTIESWLSCDDYNETERHIMRAMQSVLYDLPSVTQKSGKWIEIDDEPHEVWECDHCGFVIDGSGCIEPYEYRDTYNFCPNCGAKMVEPQESEE